ncbi:MAG: hypothetical protein M5U28_34045 [Sandaracinaceae bacterium]|nr:hypothetical protein [Sandaracinaceae bacterium]
MAALLEELPEESRRFAVSAAESLGLSMRGFTRALRVAGTIAALEASERARPEHVAEALSYRLLDRAEEPARGGARAFERA